MLRSTASAVGAFLIAAVVFVAPAGATVNQTPIGFHDGSTLAVAHYGYCYANGWANDPDDPSADVMVRILADGTQVWEGVADLFRQDLLDAGVDDGTAAFWVELDGLIAADVPHQIRVQAQDVQTAEWVDLEATPRTITCTGLWGNHDGNSGIVGRGDCMASGWAFDADSPNGPRVQVRVRVDGRIVAETTADLLREDVRDAGYGDGYSGFEVSLFGHATPGRPRIISIEMRDTTAKRLWIPIMGSGLELECRAG